MKQPFLPELEAGAVVLEDVVIPPYSLVAGVPARIVRDLRAEVAAWSQEGHAQ